MVMGKVSIVMEREKQRWQSQSVLGTVRRWARSPAANKASVP
jgi:hypothetical protein